MDAQDLNAINRGVKLAPRRGISGDGEKPKTGISLGHVALAGAGLLILMGGAGIQLDKATGGRAKRKGTRKRSRGRKQRR